MWNKFNIIFDELSNFIIYGLMVGIKVLNIFINQVVKMYGKDENFCVVNLGLY